MYDKIFGKIPPMPEHMTVRRNTPPRLEGGLIYEDLSAIVTVRGVEYGFDFSAVTDSHKDSSRMNIILCRGEDINAEPDRFLLDLERLGEAKELKRALARGVGRTAAISEIALGVYAISRLVDYIVISNRQGDAKINLYAEGNDALIALLAAFSDDRIDRVRIGSFDRAADFSDLLPKRRSYPLPIAEITDYLGDRLIIIDNQDVTV